jgi:DNA-binding NarL/FixJ family response regulator
MDKIKIAIADDHNLVRQTIARSLESDKNYKVIGQAENGASLLEIIRRETPDLVILDIEMPVMDGLQVLDVLKAEFPEIRTIVLSMHFDNLFITDLINRGARGFLPKNSDFDNLLNAISEVMSTGYFFAKKVNMHLVKELVDKNSIRPAFSTPKLTEKEEQVLDLICHDKMIKDIADIMEVSERTVERYKTGLYEKTRARTVVGLVLFAIKNNLFSPQVRLRNEQ